MIKRLIGTTGGFGYKSQFENRDIALMESAINGQDKNKELEEKMDIEKILANVEGKEVLK